MQKRAIGQKMTDSSYVDSVRKKAHERAVGASSLLQHLLQKRLLYIPPSSWPLGLSRDYFLDCLFSPCVVNDMTHEAGILQFKGESLIVPSCVNRNDVI